MKFNNYLLEVFSALQVKAKVFNEFFHHSLTKNWNFKKNFFIVNIVIIKNIRPSKVLSISIQIM